MVAVSATSRAQLTSYDRADVVKRSGDQQQADRRHVADASVRGDEARAAGCRQPPPRRVRMNTTGESAADKALGCGNWRCSGHTTMGVSRPIPSASCALLHAVSWRDRAKAEHRVL